MSQIQVKQIISSLCNILEWFEFSKVTAEDFRLAKFDKPEVVKKFWLLLFELIYYLENVKKPGFKKLNPDLIVAYFDREQPENIIKYVKIKMMELSYPNQEFYKLHESFDVDKSSRDLLISIAWFISHYEIIDMFIKNSKCFNDEEYFNELLINDEKIEKITEEVADIREKFNVKENDEELLSQLTYLKWLNGAFKFKLNSFYSCEIEKVKLTNKAHEMTKSANSSHFSCLELYLLKHHQLIDKYEKLLAKNNELKSNLLSWLRNEDLFWKWMESVLEEKHNNQQKQEEINSSTDLKSFENVLFKATKEKIIKSIDSEQKFFASLSRLKSLESEIQERIFELDRGEIGEFSEKNQTRFKTYEAELNTKFEMILNSQSLNELDLDHQRTIDYLNLDLGRLKLFAKKPSKIVDSDGFSIKKRTSLLKQESDLLERTLEEDKKRAWNKCQRISSKMDDCYVVFNK